MDIYIKSFNRPYLLERVLQSIVRYAKGFDKVVILEDGTPKIYLDRIQKEYPFVQFRYSHGYERKAKGERANMAAPTQFWREEIEKATDYFLLLEDDIWLKSEINLEYIQEFCKQKDISLYKLKWWGNKKLINGQTNDIDKNSQLIKPKIRFASEIFVRNKFYIHSILILLKLMPKNYFTEMYTIYDVAGHVFNRSYYLYVWPNEQNFIQEMIQLGRAAKWFRKNKEKKIGKAKNEHCITTFTTSSTGDKMKLGFDMDYINQILNQSWLQREFNSMENFPNDFTINYIKSFLEDKITPPDIENWKKWSIAFRKHFISIGFILDETNNYNELQ
ncbi:MULTISPECIES: hypothetical protein [Sphingobacterium]|uniref:hypothetical protein n=1 Tax=Sphingobacterium TaxID=28453 RepID=UPI00257C3837|nr:MULTISPECIES: hypothetical protein [Sphingobacterium]